jgi:hypothetical protein
MVQDDEDILMSSQGSHGKASREIRGCPMVLVEDDDMAGVEGVNKDDDGSGG